MACPKGGAGLGLRAAASKLVPMAQVAYIRAVRGWEPRDMSAVTMLFEGSHREVAAQRREVCCGLAGGSAPRVDFTTKLMRTGVVWG